MLFFSLLEDLFHVIFIMIMLYDQIIIFNFLCMILYSYCMKNLIQIQHAVILISSLK